MKGAIIPCSPPVCHSMDWKKQLASAITSPAALLQQLALKPEQVGNGQAEQLFPLRVPQPYVDRMEPGNPDDPLFKQIWPADEEFRPTPGYTSDPLEEADSNPIAGLLHKYGTRVLTISAASCAINCRYCFRRHFNYQEQSYSESVWNKWLEYIVKNPEIDEVILSGGEPLLMSDNRLKRLSDKLAQLPQIKRLRIHSRLPLVIPLRITDELLETASQSPLQWILVWHINHPNEIDSQVAEAAQKCHQAGIRQFNQSVLLKGVNDNSDALCALSETLFAHHIQPYYLHLLDKVADTAHFDTALEDAEQLYQQMLARLSGYLIPKLVREIPGEHSKTPVYSSNC